MGTGVRWAGSIASKETPGMFSSKALWIGASDFLSKSLGDIACLCTGQKPHSLDRQPMRKELPRSRVSRLLMLGLKQE